MSGVGVASIGGEEARSPKRACRSRGPRPADVPAWQGDGGRDQRDAPWRRAALSALAGVLLLGTTGCDNIAKHVPWFAFMIDGPAAETYEERPTPPPEGAVPVDGLESSYPLPVADTTSELSNPLSGTEEELARGEELYGNFCLPCHGETGEGDGPVVNADGEHPGRMPAIPTLDLTAGTAPERSDGYIWGIIENGRGLMPEYSRIPSSDRWHIVEYVRQLQRDAGAEPQRGVAGPASAAAGGTGGGAAVADAEAAPGDGGRR